MESNHPSELSDLQEIRRQKAEALREQALEPYSPCKSHPHNRRGARPVCRS